MCSERIDSIEFVELFLNYTQIVGDVTTALRGVALIIDSAGVFEHGGDLFLPVVPTSGVHIQIAEPDDEMEAGPSSPAKRKRSDGMGEGPDPFNVTIANLRGYVEALSNPATPVAIRQYFAENNPIPGADFNNAYLLTNPDIMPARYRERELRRDLAKMKATLDECKGKNDHLVAELTYSGRGNSSRLVSAYTKIAADNVDKAGSIEFTDSRYYAYRKLTEQQFMIGAINLLGEQPFRHADDPVSR